MEIFDRYGGPDAARPDPATMCRGQCEGLGCYPTNDKSEWPPDAKPDELGYVFVKCPDCGGTGQRKTK